MSLINRSLLLVESAVSLVLRLISRPRSNLRRVIPYRSCATSDTIYFSGRLLSCTQSPRIRSSDSLWMNLKRVLQMFESDEVSNGAAEVICRDSRLGVSSDSEGYLTGRLPVSHQLLAGWQRYRFFLPENQRTFYAKAYLPEQAARVGVISDIDDTILKSEVSSLLRMIWWTISKNSFSRVAIKNVSLLLNQLRSADGIRTPFFYVSNSPWNLYPMIEKFLDRSGLPDGAIFLRDFGIDTEALRAERKNHKFETAKLLFERYPHLKFFLFGDNSEADPEIYLRLTKEFPGRVLLVLINDTGAGSSPEIVGQFAELGIEAIYHRQYNGLSKQVMAVLREDPSG